MTTCRPRAPRGGHLATITSEEEHNELLASMGGKVIKDLQPWMGATQSANGDWITGQAFSYSRINLDSAVVNRAEAKRK